MEYTVKERHKIPHARVADLACFRRVRSNGELVGERIMRCTGVMKRDCPLLQLKACPASLPSEQGGGGSWGLTKSWSEEGPAGSVGPAALGLCRVCHSKSGFCS